MICLSCRERHHGECRGGSWCDCQHQAGSATPSTPSGPATRPPREAPGAPGAPEPSGERPPGAAAEPRVNWKRQG